MPPLGVLSVGQDGDHVAKNEERQDDPRRTARRHDRGKKGHKKQAQTRYPRLRNPDEERPDHGDEPFPGVEIQSSAPMVPSSGETAPAATVNTCHSPSTSSATSTGRTRLHFWNHAAWASRRASMSERCWPSDAKSRALAPPTSK